jgi:hypothetical protein
VGIPIPIADQPLYDQPCQPFFTTLLSPRCFALDSNYVAAVPSHNDLAPNPWTTEGEASAARQDYSRAAQKLIARGRPREELQEVERLALELVLAVGTIFVNAPAGSLAPKLREALSLLQASDVAERRAQAIRAILQWAPAWQQADDRNRPWVIRKLIHALSSIDVGFADANTESLGEKLAAFHPAEGHPGARSAPSILAEIIAQDCDALELTSDPNEPEEAEIERIRKALEEG